MLSPKMRNDVWLHRTVQEMNERAKEAIGETTPTKMVTVKGADLRFSTPRSQRSVSCIELAEAAYPRNRRFPEVYPA